MKPAVAEGAGRHHRARPRPAGDRARTSTRARRSRPPTRWASGSAQIVKSLVFTADGRPLLVIASGANRVDERRLGALAGGQDPPRRPGHREAGHRLYHRRGAADRPRRARSRSTWTATCSATIWSTRRRACPSACSRSRPRSWCGRRADRSSTSRKLEATRKERGHESSRTRWPWSRARARASGRRPRCSSRARARRSRWWTSEKTRRKATAEQIEKSRRPGAGDPGRRLEVGGQPGRVQQTVARWGRLDVFYANAGVPQFPTPVENVDEAVFDRSWR